MWVKSGYPSTATAEPPELKIVTYSFRANCMNKAKKEVLINIQWSQTIHRFYKLARKDRWVSASDLA